MPRPAAVGTALLVTLLVHGAGMAAGEEAADAEEARLQRLHEWAVARGTRVYGVRLARIPIYGSGVVATRRIERGEELLSVPEELFFTPEALPVASRMYDVLERSAPLSSVQHSQLATAIGLIAVKHDAKLASQWGVYLDVLPTAPMCAVASDPGPARPQSPH